MNLQGKVALVTGAARRLGKAIALALAEEGAHLVVHYGRSDAEAQQTVDELRQRGSHAVAIQADLADPDAIARLFEAVDRQLNRLDVLVNSASTFRACAFDAIDAAQWDEVLAVNLRAPFLCTQHAARLMRAVPRGEGETALVVNLADLSGVSVWTGYAHHAVSKAGLIHLTHVAARELAPVIRVNAVVAGPILPPMGMDPDGEPWRRITRRVPLGRAGRPDEIAQAVLFLAKNDYMTGAVLAVDGGEHLRVARPGELK